MTCPRCRTENREGRRFCAKCAAPLATACPSGGFSNEPGEDFCGGCAAPLAAASRPAEARFASPQSYTPKHLAEKILTSKSALEGERKQVTVLFADLKGSMELLADRDPEEARKLLDPVLERMMEAVHRYEGTVNQVMGDGIMALFGAPVAHEDHAVRACYAALDMQGAIRRYAEEVRRTFGIRTEIRIGLNSGEVVVRAIGSDLRMDYTAVGQTTHLAARMEQLASAGTTLLTADTLRLAEGFVAVKPLGPVPVKGLEAPVEVYEMLGAGPLRSRLQAAAARGLTRFVGRETEIEQLRQALSRAAAGHGQLVALVGEPGVGKSRLVWEVTHSHRIHGWLTVQASLVSYGKATPYLPVIDLLKGYLKIQDQDDPRAVREKVTGKLLTLDETFKPTVPAFLTLLDVPVDDAAWSALDPPQRRQRTLEAVKRLLLRESQVQPLLVVLEDLHWIDGETQALLDSLVESLPTARMLLLVNYRPEYAHRWGSKTYYTQLRLDPLPPESAEALLDALAGSDPALRPLKHLLIERTEGNPFFLEESVRTLVETKGLAGERGAYRLAQALPSIQVPATVQAVLAARIDRLAAEEKRLLQAAAVIGKDVPVAVLQAIAEVPEDVLRHSLATLQASEFLHEARLFPDLEYTFKHALTHEVAYGSLLQDRRRALHARIVPAIERLYPERLAEHVERLAHHALRGELWDEAPGYLRQAGRRALGRSAYREAAGWLEQALEALGHVHESRATRELAIDLRLDLRNALWPAGDHAPILARLREAEALAEALGDQRRLGQVRQMLANSLRVEGESRLAIEVGERARAIAARLGDDPLSWSVSADMAAAHASLGEFRRAVALLGPVVDAVQDHPQGAQAVVGATFEPVYARLWLALALGALGEFREACLRGQEAVMLAADQPARLVMAQFALGLARLNQGDLVPAITSLERAVAVCREWDIVDWLGGAATALGLALVLEGRVSEGRAIAHEGMSRVARARGPSSSHLVTTAEAELEARDPDAALVLAEQALGLARRRGEQGSVARALRLLGAIASEREAAAGRPAGSRQHGAILFSQALALAGELGMRPLVAHCHFGLGKLYRRTDNRERAQEHLATATAMYREMGMNFWLEKAEAALRSLG